MHVKKNIAFFSIKRPIFIASLTILLLLIGWISFNRMGVDLYPDVDPTSIEVRVAYAGASPEEIERLITKPLEDQISSIAGLKRLTSQNYEGISIVNVEFTLETDIKYAEQQLRDKVAAARVDLPDDAEEAEYRKRDTASMPIMRFSLQSDLPPAKLYDLANEVIKIQMQQVNNVGEVEIHGGSKREIQVELDNEKLNAYRIPASTVVNQLQNSGVNIPVGKHEKGATETVFRALGEFENLKAIGDAVILFSGDVSNAVSIKNLGKVVDGVTDKSSSAYIYYPYETVIEKRGLIFKEEVAVQKKTNDTETHPSLFLNVYKQSGSNTVAVADAMNARIAKINETIKNHPGKPKINLVFDQSKMVRDNVEDVNFTIIIGIILAVITVYLFLGNLRSTFITGIAIPTSLFGAFILMYLAGFTINLMSLMALSLAVGLLIDDAIVIQENIYRKRETGMKLFEAAEFGTEEVKLAVIATTLVVISVFMPVGLLTGTIGRFFRPFGFSVVFAMAISLMAALTIAPLLNAYFGGKGEKNHNRLIIWFDGVQDKIDLFYDKVIDFSLSRPLTVILSTIAIFIASIFMMIATPKTFQPEGDSGEFNLNIELKSGSSLDGTREVVAKIEPRLKSIPEIKYYTLSIGNIRSETHKATFGIKCVDRSERKLDTNEIKQKVRKMMKSEFAYADPYLSNPYSQGGGGKPFILNISGEDLATVDNYSKQLITAMSAIKDLTEISSNFKPGKPEFQVILDPLKMQTTGVQPKSAGSELRTYIAGTVAAKLRESGLEYDVRVRLNPEQRNLKAHYSKIRVPNTQNKLVPLSAISTTKETVGPSVIMREDRARVVQLSANLIPGGAIGNAITQARGIIAKMPPPAGISYKFTGQSESYADLVTGFLIAFGLAILFIYLVLSSLYDSFITPITILAALPPALTGAFTALFAFRAIFPTLMFDMFSMIGLVALLGLVTKNSILLVDFALEGMRAGMTQKQAIKRAGKTRLRPIIMTSIAIVMGTLPLAFGVGEAAAYRKSMGIAIIGGVIFSTFVTLVLVPAIFEYVDKLRELVERKVLDEATIKEVRNMNMQEAKELVGTQTKKKPNKR